MKVKEKFGQYKKAVNDVFTARIHNPSLLWSPDCGFFVSPTAKLVPLDPDEVEIGEAYYDANTGERSLKGTLSEYTKAIKRVEWVLRARKNRPKARGRCGLA